MTRWGRVAQLVASGDETAERRPTVVVSSVKGEGDDDGRACRDGDHRRRSGGSRCRIPPQVAESAIPHTRRERARRRFVAQALALASAVLPGKLRRSSGHGISGPGPLVPDRSRDGRLPRVLRKAVRATRPIRDHRRRAREERGRIRRDRRRSSARRGQRGRRDGCVPARAPDRSRVRGTSSIPRFGSSTPPTTADRSNCSRGRCSWSARRTREATSRSRLCARGTRPFSPEGTPARFPSPSRAGGCAWHGPFCASCGHGS